MTELVYLDGWIGSFEDAYVPVNDRGYNFGDGIYEVIRVYNGKLFGMEEHLNRFFLSARAVEMDLPWGTEELTTITNNVLAQSGIVEAMVYMQATRGVAPRNHIYEDGIKPSLLITIRAVPERPSHMYTQGVKIITQPEFRWQLCNIKSTSLQGAVLAKNRALRAGAAEVLFVLPDGTVTECGASNIFIYSGGTLFTHPTGNKILSGITRQQVLKVARAQGIAVQEEPFKLADLMAAEEIFFTGTIVEVVPVVNVDGTAVAGGRPGSVTASLHRGFSSLR